MSKSAATQLNRDLQAIFDVEDSLYKYFISDPDGDHIDLSMGILGSPLEYNRQLTLSLARMMVFTNTEGDFVDLFAWEICGILRTEGESDGNYIDRTVNIILGPKISPAAIIHETREYSDTEPELIEGEYDSAFASTCFAGYYKSFYNEERGEYITAAITAERASGNYYFRLILTGIVEKVFTAGTPELIDSFSIAPVGPFFDIERMIDNNIVFIDETNQEFRWYEFESNSWNIIGSGLSIGAITKPKIARMTNTKFAFFDLSNKELRCYEFNGSTFNQIGTGLSISSAGTNFDIAGMTDTDIAFIDYANKQLRCYRFDGSTWSMVGAGLTISSLYYPYLLAMNSTDIILVDSGNDQLRYYRFNGSTWSMIGTGLNTGGTGSYYSLAKLNDTDFAYIDAALDTLKCFTFDGSTFSQIGVGLSVAPALGIPIIASLTDIDIVFMDSSVDNLQVYRMGEIEYIDHTRDSSSAIIQLVDLVKRIKAAGIRFDIEIRSTIA